MSPRSRSIAALAVALLVGIRLVAVAQKPDVLEVFVSGVKHAPFPTVQGDHRRDFAFASIRGGWMKARGSSSLMWTVDVVPVAVSTNNTFRYDTVACGRNCWFRVPRGRTTSGAGIIPLGLHIDHRLSPRVGLTLEGNAGAIWFDRNFPDPYARRMNFALGAATGMSFDVNKHSALSFGVLRHHLSNGGTAPVNPGVNAWMLRVGFVHRRDE